MQPLASTEFYAPWSDDQDHENALTIEAAQNVFDYFKNSSLFKWNSADN
jgi:hypothetical protein